MASAIRPCSEEFQTLVDSNGNNRIVINTDKNPWTDPWNDPRTAPLLTLKQIFLAKCIMYNRHYNLGDGISNTHIGMYIAARVTSLDLSEDVSENDTIGELWAKVRAVEDAIKFFIEFDAYADGNYRLHEPHLDVVQFVCRHTCGYVYKRALAILNEFLVHDVTVAPRGWKCPICCEKYGESHMCHAFSCGHLVHFSCKTGMLSGECPVCRTLD